MTVFYDIACKLKRHLQVHRPMRRMPDAYFIPILHSYAHDESCLVEYNPRVALGAGTVDGEVVERVWSELEINAGSTQRETLENRIDSVSLIAEYHAAENATHFVRVLTESLAQSLAASRDLLLISPEPLSYEEARTSNQLWRDLKLASTNTTDTSCQADSPPHGGLLLQMRKAALCITAASVHLRRGKSKKIHMYWLNVKRKAYVDLHNYAKQYSTLVRLSSVEFPAASDPVSIALGAFGGRAPVDEGTRQDDNFWRAIEDVFFCCVDIGRAIVFHRQSISEFLEMGSSVIDHDGCSYHVHAKVTWHETQLRHCLDLAASTHSRLVSSQLMYFVEQVDKYMTI